MISFSSLAGQGQDFIFVFVTEHCPHLDPVKNGTWMPDSLTYGTESELQCDEGHLPVGNLTKECTEDAVWEPSQAPSCPGSVRTLYIVCMGM